MVSIWLTTVNGGGENREMKKTGFARQGRFSLNAVGSLRSLLAVLLDAGGAQAGQAMLVDGKLPGQEFVDGEGVAAASFFQRQQPAADRGHDFGLAAYHPPFGAGRWQIRNR
jgi:hypothetical protein